ncbi:SDR family oxidoreductase [Mesorhizobium sp. B292B1B]|uniref:SDR family oxidoreductase n=1 Tax=unclassified Mesorhizobium TaxID=325217 RepID=UPI001129FBA7|nr:MULTISPECIES: SDR family oxidoreductase [unclassified Mesorhizobium]MCA0010961.1 SDR family oxidoreductase [Mesorhizobium sp. B294B1A1]MCA0035845.1 SDR family oxidoreductase [Mesorhizobium sp. B292B1B]TPM48952.1 SDR family oxidoreductase [Mesorhizobium sp. B2-3-2]
MLALANKIAIVTGASSGIGHATAKLFAEEGAKVVAAARRQAELDGLVEEIVETGGTAIALAGDVRDEAYAKALVDLATGSFGGLDIAFNNAGAVGMMAPLPDLPPASWHDTMDTNLTSAYLAARHQIPAMLERGGGSLVFTSSFVGYTAGMPGMAAYAAAKAGLIGLTQVLAAEYGPKGLRVNALLPGGTDTPAATFKTPESRAFVESLHALKRVAEPEEIARSALYLASDASSFTTGTALFADGGVSINRT